MDDPKLLLGPDGAPMITATQEVDQLRNMLREAVEDRRVAQRQADLFAYHLIGMAARQEQDLPHKTRIKLVRQAREIWKKDAQAGASTRLFNDFVFGLGVNPPKCHDPVVQEVVDEAWYDRQNQRILTSPEAQRKKGTDLAIQSNLYFLLFSGRNRNGKQGDGKVKLGLLEHDSVDAVVRDDENRHRILLYKASRFTSSWDFDRHQEVRGQDAIIEYYEAWGARDEVEEEGGKFPDVPKKHQGVGEVFHTAINSTSEMAFGHPEMHRVVQWYSAFNEFMASRVDLTKAAAAIWMKKKVKGGEQAVLNMAQKTMTRRSELATEAGAPQQASRMVGGMLVENESVSHEPFSFNTNAGNASQDADMLHTQMAAATGWPKHYTGGDAGALAGATALELPVLKLVESRQQVFEQVFRWFIDRVIEAAVETGRIPQALDPSELTESARRYRRTRLRAIAASTKPPADVKGGHLVVRRADGRLVLREIAQTPPDDIEAAADLSRHPYFHTNNLWFDLEQLAQTLADRAGILGLPLIRNEKTVDPTDPSSPRVVQIESAMGAAIEVFDGATAIEVDRSRFVGVKTTNDLMLLRSDVYGVGEDFRLRAQVEPPLVDLDRRFYATIADFDARVPEPPSLVDATSLTVRGDWRFGRGVAVSGDVRLDDEGTARSIPGGTRLG